MGTIIITFPKVKVNKEIIFLLVKFQKCTV